MIFGKNRGNFKLWYTEKGSLQNETNGGGKRKIIKALLQEYDIETADDI
ncbi:MAG: hypothetical protein HFG79_10840 [Lachnospiraceae bacterium]|jgi:hypothetical protein|nr:hypothetical protein [Lachnospiraceae bacterium]